MIHSILIARSSTDRHDVSCKSQIAEMRAEAQKRGELIVKELEFPRIRHSDFLEDPDFKEVLAEAKLKDRNWTKIWFYDTSRLSRTRAKAQATKIFFRRHGIQLDFLKNPSTGFEPVDNMMEGILETFDQLISDYARAGSIRGQKQNIRSGYRAGGRAPYGYQLKKHQFGLNVDNHEITKSTLEPHPEHFPIVKEYLERRALGESRNAILREFKTRNIKSPSGMPYWQASTCNSIENNLLVYCGHLVYNRHNKTIDGRYVGGEKFRSEDEWEINKNVHPAAINEQQASAIKKQLTKHKIKTTQPRKYLLTGILQCGICKGPMVGDSGFYTCINKKKHITDCTNSKISADYINKKAIAFVKETLLTKTHFQNVIAATKQAYQAEIRKTQKDSSRIETRISELNSQIARLMELYERGKVSPETIENRVSLLEQERDNLQETLAGEQSIISIIQYAESELNSKTIKDYIDHFEELLTESNLDQMREFLRTFISKIELGKKVPGQKNSREVHLHGHIPALTGITLASPGGIEPPL